MNFKKTLLFLFFISLNLIKAQEAKKILIFSYTEGFVHPSIANGLDLFKDFAEKNQLDYETSIDPSLFNDAYLKDIDLIILNQTTGNLFNEEQEAAFVKYIENGGNLFGIHAAVDAERGFPFYGETIGAIFNKHPLIQTSAKMTIEGNHPIMAGVVIDKQQKDEWYNFKAPLDESKFTVLVSIDEDSYCGGKMGDRHPIVWYSENGVAKMFYTGAGHRKDMFKKEWFTKMLKNSLIWLTK